MSSGRVSGGGTSGGEGSLPPVAPVAHGQPLQLAGYELHSAAQVSGACGGCSTIGTRHAFGVARLQYYQQRYPTFLQGTY